MQLQVTATIQSLNNDVCQISWLVLRRAVMSVMQQQQLDLTTVALQTSESQPSQASNFAVSATSNGINSNFSGFLKEAVGGIFTAATFNNSPVNVSINLNSNVSRL